MELPLLLLLLCLVDFFALINLYRIDAAQCYDAPSSASFKGAPLYPLDPYGLSGQYSGFWSNTTANYTIDNVFFQVWLLSYNSSNPASFYLSLVVIRNPSIAWELVTPLVVWTANRDRPVNHETANLEFGSDGNLKLSDNGSLVWETGTANKGVVSLCVEDYYSSIVLRDASRNAVWKSIDDPTDTLQMQTAFMPRTKLVSWKSAENFSTGPYSLVMEKNGLALYFNSQPYWIFSFSGENNTKSVLGEQTSEKIYSALCWQSGGTITLDLRTNLADVGDVNIVGNEACAAPSPRDRRMLFPVNGSEFTYYTFLRLTPVGELALYSWDQKLKAWRVYFNLSSLFKCFLPAQCGAYRACDRDINKCNETCPSTVFRLDNGECTLSYIEQVEARTSTCSVKDDTFVEVPGSDYFYTKFVSPLRMSKEECRETCKANCSCKAAFHRENSCFQTYADVQSLGTGDYLALLRVTNENKVKQRSDRRTLSIVLGVLLPVLVILTGCLAWRLGNMGKMNESFYAEDEEILVELSQRTSMPKRYTYQEVEEITVNFSHCLGNGGFGSVYLGKLADGTQVAVKKLEGSNQRSKDFFTEVAVLAKTHHWNLVRLLGFCAEGPTRRLLVYEYMAHGSLETWIFDSRSKLPWEVRFGIAVGTARGLSYLHEQCDEKIVHLDLKPENVLLDDKLQPKIADFGLSRLMNRDEDYVQMTTVRGTPGYVAPEVLQEGTVTEKSDVYSFGVLLLEIISGFRNKHMPSSYLDLQHDNTADSVSKGKEEIIIQEKRMKAIAFLCVQDDPEDRPSMTKVIQMMENMVDVCAPSVFQLHFFLSNRLRAMNTSSSSAPKTESTQRFSSTNSSSGFFKPSFSFNAR